MSNTFKLTARHGNMFTFARSVNGVLTDYLRGFGKTEAEALEDARSELVDACGQLMYRKPFADPWNHVAKCVTY